MAPAVTHRNSIYCITDQQEQMPTTGTASAVTVGTTARRYSYRMNNEGHSSRVCNFNAHRLFENCLTKRSVRGALDVARFEIIYFFPPFYARLRAFACRSVYRGSRTLRAAFRSLWRAKIDALSIAEKKNGTKSVDAK